MRGAVLQYAQVTARLVCQSDAVEVDILRLPSDIVLPMFHSCDTTRTYLRTCATRKKALTTLDSTAVVDK